MDLCKIKHDNLHKLHKHFGSVNIHIHILSHTKTTAIILKDSQTWTAWICVGHNTKTWKSWFLFL